MGSLEDPPSCEDPRETTIHVLNGKTKKLSLKIKDSIPNHLHLRLEIVWKASFKLHRPAAFAGGMKFGTQISPLLSVATKVY